MAADYKILFTPFKLGPIEIQNRIGFGPHAGWLESWEGTLSEEQLSYYSERLKTGIGLVTFGCQSVHPVGMVEERNVRAWDFERAEPGWRRLVSDCHDHGAAIIGQITHAGATPCTPFPQVAWGPSRVADSLTGLYPKEMEKEDIQEAIAAYASAAANLMKAGFDGVELKMAHDGMLRQFASALYNHRSDEYGGTTENRARLALEVMAAVREAIGPKKALGVRLCMDEFLPGGWSLDHGVELAKLFAGGGNLDYISVGQGSYVADYGIFPPMALPLGCFLYMAVALKENIDLPVVYTGRVNDPVQADKILADGQADVVMMVRPFISDSEWLSKARDGKVDDIRKCMACGDGCAHKVWNGRHFGCVQNPAVGQELTLGLGTLRPAAVAKKVAVVGGGPAGLKAAEIAARRGHKVVLFEKSADLGGTIKAAIKAPTRDELGEAVRWLIRQIDQLGVEVRTNTTVTPEMILEDQYGAVVVATGSTPSRPGFSGGDKPNVISALDVMLGAKPVGQKVVVVDNDGHWKAGGVAELLANEGKEVHVVTGAPMPMMKTFHGGAMLYWQRIWDNNYRFTGLHGVKDFSDKKVTIAHVVSGEEAVIDGVDTVVVAQQDDPDESLYFALKGRVSELYRVGDCVVPRLMEHAIVDGELTARRI